MKKKIVEKISFYATADIHSTMDDTWEEVDWLVELSVVLLVLVVDRDIYLTNHSSLLTGHVA